MWRERYTPSIQSCYQHLPSVTRQRSYPFSRTWWRKRCQLEYRRKAKVIARANQLTRRYKNLKQKGNTGCPIQSKRPRLKDDPLNVATRPSVGCPKNKKGDTNKKTNGRYESPIYHLYFHHLILFMRWLSIILLKETVILRLSTSNWKMHYPRLKATRYLSPSSIAGKISLHINVCFA